MKSKTSFSFQASSLKRRSFGSAWMTGFSASMPKHAAGRVLPERHVVLPEADLGLDQLGRVAHQLGGHLHEGVADVHGVELGQLRATGG